MIGMLLLSAFVFALALLPVAMFLRNLRDYRPATTNPQLLRTALQQPVSILIPARNEAAGIATTLEHLRKSTHPQWEALILDDHSEDATAVIVSKLAQVDPRIQLHSSLPLPAGWNGKQHACWQLAQWARHDLLLFVDADVHLTSDALTRIVAERERLGCDLLSGFPRQRTESWAECLLIPLMHYVLLGFLPLQRMRMSTDPSLAAGCGQLFLALRKPYFDCGGHQAIQASRHDGIMLPRTFRRAHLRTDLFDATDTAACRMYTSRAEVVRGLLKNAHEGIANPRLIVPFSILLIVGSVMPWVLLAISIWRSWPGWLCAGIAITALMSLLPRLLAAKQFRQSWWGAMLHPLAVVWFVALQWYSLIQRAMGRSVAWRGRT